MSSTEKPDPTAMEAELAALNTKLATPKVDAIALPFKTFDQCREASKKRWLIKGVLAEDECSSWFGKPDSGKSSIKLDLAVALATATSWRDYRVKQKRGTVFFALERAGTTERRLHAYAIRDKLEGLPIVVCPEVINLFDPVCVDRVVATVRAVEKQFTCDVGLLIFDTWSKLISAGGGDEDKAAHVNLLAANFRRIHQALGNRVHCSTIGHSGKDAAKGERGSSAKLGHVDMEILVEGDAVKTVKVTKGNDTGKGAITTFAMERVLTGMDEDGDVESAWIVKAGVPVAVEDPKPKKPTKSARDQLAMNALDVALRDHGIEVNGYKLCTTERWREACYATGALSSDAENPWRDFGQLRDRLIEADMIAEDDGMVRSRDVRSPPTGNAESKPVIPPLPVLPKMH